MCGCDREATSGAVFTVQDAKNIEQQQAKAVNNRIIVPSYTLKFLDLSKAKKPDEDGESCNDASQLPNKQQEGETSKNRANPCRKAKVWTQSAGQAIQRQGKRLLSRARACSALAQAGTRPCEPG